MTERMETWKEKFQELVTSCQIELKRTAEIGKKMISASKANTTLTESYESLGRLVYLEMKEGRLDWDSKKAKTLIENIDHMKAELEVYEHQVQKIKQEKNL